MEFKVGMRFVLRERKGGREAPHNPRVIFRVDTFNGMFAYRRSDGKVYDNDIVSMRRQIINGAWELQCPAYMLLPQGV